MSAVEFNGVSLALRGRTILSNIDLQIHTNEFVGVLGPNGAGKTTLMRAILGLVPPVEGVIQVLGKATARGNPLIGYMPQLRANGLYGRLSGRDFIAAAAGGTRWGLPVRSRIVRRDIDRVLELVGATALAARPLAELSGGERQRLLISQALLGRPRLLLLDEPLISLDPQHQANIVQLVRDVQSELALCVLFTAHDINSLLGSLDRVLYLAHGRAELGSIAEVVSGPVLSRLYGSPIEVVRVGGRVFVLPGNRETEDASRTHRQMPHRV